MSIFTGEDGRALDMANEYRTQNKSTMLVPRPSRRTARVTALATIGRTEKIPGSATAGGLANPFDDIDRNGDGRAEHLGLLRSAANAITAAASRTFRRPLERHPIPVAAVERRTRAM